MIKCLTLVRTNILAICLGMIISVSSCKKDKSFEEEPPAKESNLKQTATMDRNLLTLDSIFLYAKEVYYWNEALPSYDDFNPRQYKNAGDELSGYEIELYNITQLKINPSTKHAYEYAGGFYPKYSYINNREDDNQLPVAYQIKEKSEVDLKGIGNDFGLRPVSYLLTDADDGPFILFITAVYPGSPADLAGVKRGWAITKINGTTIGSSFGKDRAIMNNALNGATVTLEGSKYEGGQKGESFSIVLSRKSYRSSPVYSSKVFTAGGKKIGYLAYARFSDEENSFKVLEDEFQKFSSQGVTDLVIDLRYNGGGYVNTAEHLINLIAPSSATGTMYVEHYNSTMQNKKATILKNQPDEDGTTGSTFYDGDFSIKANTFNFKKKGSLNGVGNVVFIVSRNTASASELVINSLKPHMNVQLVGDSTYGKPVGFFPITIQNKYEVYMSMFETRNSAGQGGYFDGMAPDYMENSNYFDNPLYDFGDKAELLLNKALNIIAPNSTVIGGKRATTMIIGGKEVSSTLLPKLRKVDQVDEFKGMIDDRRKAKN